MHRILVEEKRWVSENRFLHALNYTMLLPGPEAQQLATYIGWLLHGTRGGLVAGILFVLPGFLSILALSVLYAGYQQLGFVQGLFFGLKPAVMAIVVEAVIRIGRRVLKNRVMVVIAALAFVSIFFFDVPFPLIVLLAGLTGYFSGRIRPSWFDVIQVEPAVDQPDRAITDIAEAGPRPNTMRSIRILTIGLIFWLGPLLALSLWLGPDNVYTRIGVFFSQAAVVTFGGAYAVLAFVAEQAVNSFGWLQPGELLDGLGMAETTPGPLIQVVQFVGFMGAYRNPGDLAPLVAGVLGAVLTTWVTFVPCFIWIFLGAPYVENLRGNRRLSSGLSAITAAVVGVVLNLGIWFSLNVLFARVDEIIVGPLRLYVPDIATVKWVPLLIAAAAFVAMFRFRVGILPLLAGAAAVGVLYLTLFL
jgi:chromate transporter